MAESKAAPGKVERDVCPHFPTLGIRVIQYHPNPLNCFPVRGYGEGVNRNECQKDVA